MVAVALLATVGRPFVNVSSTRADELAFDAMGRLKREEYEDAIVLYLRAIERHEDYEHAWHNLGYCYARGLSVPKDDEEALRLYRAAARQGYALSQYVLGTRYRNGRGVPQDDVRAYAWLTLAAQRGLTRAETARDVVETKLSSDQLARARELMEELVPDDSDSASE